MRAERVENIASIAEDRPDWAQGLTGRLRAEVPLAKRCWFQVGGPAEWLYTPEDTADLQRFMRQKPDGLPVFVLGVGSNLLVRDGGMRGVVIRLGRGFAGIEVQTDGLVRAGAAAMDLNVALVARDHGRGGLEFLSGIPGTIGGALAMNAGAYGREMKDVLVTAELVLADGQVVQMSPEELGYRYRHSDMPDGAIFTAATMRTDSEETAVIAERMQRIAEERDLSQPTRARTGGSTFKNPDGHKAWELIDAAGCRGFQMSDAQVSEKHCNFLINNGEASAADEEVRRRVEAESGVMLQWEIKRIGEAA